MKRLVTFSFVVIVLALAKPVSAALLLDTGLGNNVTVRSADSGPGQGVAVGIDTELNQIGFYIGTPDPANVKFMIWNETNTVLLFSQVVALEATPNGTLVLSNPFSFLLTAGSTYHFGIIGDNNQHVSFFRPSIEHSENGLTLVGTNSNYRNFAAPFSSSGGLVNIALQLHGTQEVPEPQILALLVVGLAAGAQRAFRRNIQNARR